METNHKNIDDGEAFRLAVRHGVLLEVVYPAYATAICKEKVVIEHVGNDLSGCIYEAARRAVVKAISLAA